MRDGNLTRQEADIIHQLLVKRVSPKNEQRLHQSLDYRTPAEVYFVD